MEQNAGTLEEPRNRENQLAGFTTDQLINELLARLGPSAAPVLEPLRPLPATDNQQVEERLQQTGNPLSIDAESPAEMTIEERADLAVQEIYTNGFALINGKFPDDTFITFNGNRIQVGDNTQNITNVGFQSSPLHDRSEIALLNFVMPKFENSYLPKNVHYFNIMGYPQAKWQHKIEELSNASGGNLDARIRESQKDGMIVFTLFSFIDKDSPNLGNGTRGNDIPMRFMFAIPKSICDKFEFIPSDFADGANFVEFVYEKLYPGLDRLVHRVPVDKSVFIPNQLRNSDDTIKLKQLEAYPLCKTFGTVKAV